MGEEESQATTLLEQIRSRLHLATKISLVTTTCIEIPQGDGVVLPASGEGPLRACAKVSETAAVSTREESMMKVCATRWKADAVVDQLSCPLMECATGQEDEGEEDASPGSTTMAATSAAMAGADENLMLLRGRSGLS